MLLETTLPLDRGKQRTLRGGEDDEEAVALGAHLMSPVLVEDLTQDGALSRQGLAPASAQAVQHQRGALYVAEQQG